MPHDKWRKSCRYPRNVEACAAVPDRFPATSGNGEVRNVYDRIEQIGELRQQFVGYAGPALPRERKSRR
jgi:hypothetical protein